MKTLPTTAEQKSLVELARDQGFDVLKFLQAVMDNAWQALGEPKPIPLSLRIAAAHLLRKYAALPANVNLELDVRKILVYEGDKNVTPLPPGRRPDDMQPLLLDTGTAAPYPRPRPSTTNDAP